MSTSCETDAAFLPMGASKVNLLFEERPSNCTAVDSDDRSNSSGLIVWGWVLWDWLSFADEPAGTSTGLVSGSGGIGRVVTT